MTACIVQSGEPHSVVDPVHRIELGVGIAVTVGDTATFVGSDKPTGSVTFTLYSDAACTLPVTGMSGSGAISGVIAMVLQTAQ